MKILITGNMGYVGPAVVRRLRKTRSGARLVGLDSGFYASCLTHCERLPETFLEEQRFADVRDVKAKDLEGVSAVIHLAAVSNDPMGKAFEAATYDINHAASVALARTAKTAGVKSFVFASSCSVYGFAGEQARSETSEVAPLTAYAKSKVYTERDIAPLADSNFRITCLRFATACGMSPRLRLDLVLNDFVASALASKRIDILSDGTPYRPLINVQDMARAFDWAVGREGDPFLVVNAGSDAWNYQILDLAKAVSETLGNVEVSVNPDAPPDKRSYKVSFEKFRKLAPDHQPSWNLRDTIMELQEGLTAMKFNDPDFRENRLMRLKILSDHREKGRLNEVLRWNPPAKKGVHDD